MRLVQFTLTLVTLLIPGLTGAYTLQKKGADSVIFSTDGNKVSANQEFYILDANNKAKVLVKVEKFNANQAKAKIVKGNINVVEPGMSLRPMRAPASIDGSQISTQAAPGKAGKKNAWGFLGSYMMSTMNAKFSYNGTNQTAAMTGTSFGTLGYYDYSVNKDLQLRAMGGLETFDATQNKETTVCDKGTSKSCTVKINYFSMYAMGKYNITKTKNRFWIGGGLGYLLATGKSSTVLDTSLITSNQVLLVGLGMDIGMGRNSIPLAVDYSLFPSSTTVSASIISLKVGFGFGL